MNDKDYSNPVGWWCTECETAGSIGMLSLNPMAHTPSCTQFRRLIPIFYPLPIPEPCVIDELPEVVTVVDTYGVCLAEPCASFCQDSDTLFDCRWTELDDYTEISHIHYVVKP